MYQETRQDGVNSHILDVQWNSCIELDSKSFQEMRVADYSNKLYIHKLVI